MEDFVFPLILICGLLVLQIVMIVKFFQIASDVRVLRRKQEGHFDTISQLKQRIELEKYLGHSEQAREIIIRERINAQNKYDALKEQGLSVGTIEYTVEYLDQELQKCGIDSKDLLASVLGLSTNSATSLQIGAIVAEKSTGDQWIIKGKFVNRLYCIQSEGTVEKSFDEKDVMPYEEYCKQNNKPQN